jgi:hypothetical protein
MANCTQVKVKPQHDFGEPFEPQSEALVRSVRSKLGRKLTEVGLKLWLYDENTIKELFFQLEGVALFVYQLMRCTDWLSVCVATTGYVRNHYRASITDKIIDLVKGGFETWRQQDNQEPEDPPTSLIDTIREMNSNWTAATTNPAFKSLTRLLSLLVGAELIDKSNLEFEVGGLKLFSEIASPTFVSAFDITDAVVKCSLLFFEGGYECIQAGSVKPLILGSKYYGDFEKKYLECKKYASYAMPGNLGIVEMTEEKYLVLLRETIELGEKLRRETTNPMAKKILSDRIISLTTDRAEMEQQRRNQTQRCKPFAVTLWGGTAVGKSVLAPRLMYILLSSLGFEAGDEYIRTLKLGAKYHESMTTTVNGLLFDDVANTVPQFVDVPPTEDYLEVVNTAMKTARMAELSMKDKVYFMPKVVVASTNKKDMDAKTYSNEPASITRRTDYFVGMKVRDQFATNGMYDPDKVSAYYDGNVPALPDVWDITIEISYPYTGTNGQNYAGFKPVNWNGRQLVNVDIQTAMKFLILAAQKQRKQQEEMLKRSTTLSADFPLCEKCKAPESLCVCHEDQLNISYGDGDRPPVRQKTKSKAIFRFREEAVPAADALAECQRTVSNVSDAVTGKVADAKMQTREQIDQAIQIVSDRMAGMNEAVTTEVQQTMDHLENLQRFAWTALVPDSVLRAYNTYVACKWIYLNWRSLAVACCSVFLYLLFFAPPLITITVTSLMFYMCYVVFLVYVDLKTRQCSDMRLTAWFSAQYVATRVAVVTTTCVSLKLLYDFLKGGQSLNLVRQSYMMPTDEEVAKRDADNTMEEVAKEHNWATVEVPPLPATAQSRTIAENDLVELVKRNTVALTQRGKLITNAFFVKSNVAVVPLHSAETWDKCQFRAVKADPKVVGANFDCLLSREHMAPIPNTDLALVYVPNGGSWKDLTMYFPTGLLDYTVGVHSVVRKANGSLTHKKVRADFETATLREPKDPILVSGYLYNMPGFKGMCGAPIVGQIKTPMILGIHTAGLEIQQKSFASLLTQDMISSAMAELAAKDSVLIGQSVGTFSREVYGKPLIDSTEIHEKSPVRKLELGEKAITVQPMGSCPGRSVFRSQVQKSIISDSVSEVFGVPNTWGPPPVHKSDPWKASLEHMSRTNIGFPPGTLDKAVADYQEPILNLLDEKPKLRKETKPMTKMQTVCGIDGKKFIDKMPPQTSPGFPLGGKKADYLEYLDPEAHEDFNCPAELDPMFWEEVETIKEAYRRGERYYPVFKACLKDEPTPVTKDKVRVFQAAPIALQLLVRQYFLPIARILSLYPKLSECAVGMNCMGLDWQDFNKHINKYGKKRIVAGDFSKFDMRLPAQVTMAAFKVLINIAKKCGYSEDDIVIMTGLATDICYPVVAYNGDLLMFLGINPSGQNLTVYINGIAVSLFYRCSYFDIVKPEGPVKPGEVQWCRGPPPSDEEIMKVTFIPFRDVMALGTYGDDSKGSVKKGYDEYNFCTIQSYFAQYGIVLTTPDKKDTGLPFTEDHLADFLKRTNVYIPEIRRNVGALDPMSIYKSLHANLSSKVLTKAQLAAACLDGGCNEAFFHGRDFYEDFRAKATTVAQRAEIDHQCIMLGCTFDDLVAKWQERYYGEVRHG